MRDEWLSGVSTTPTNTRFVSAFYGSPHVRLYTRIKSISIWETGLRGLEGTEGYVGGRVVWGCVRSLISKADDLWRASTLPRDLLTALSWADWLYDKGRASTHPHEKGWLRCGVVVTRPSGVVRMIRMRMPETQWKCNSILREGDFGPGPY